MQYYKDRYIDNPHYSLMHVRGLHAAESAIPYLHYSRRYQLMYFKCGNATIKIEGRNYKIQEGDIILLNPSELFRLYVDDEAYHERLSFSLGEELFAEYPNAASSLFAPFYNRNKGFGNKISAEAATKHGVTTHIENTLELLKSSKPSSPLLAFCEICHLLVALNEASETAPAIVQAVSNPLISGVLDYLNLHFTEELTIPSLSAQFSIDKSHLSHLFKEYVGMSIWTYVILRRLQLFNRIICEEPSIEEAAFKSGFKNYSNFFRLYKKYIGVTPTQYKKQFFSKKKTEKSPHPLV